MSEPISIWQWRRSRSGRVVLLIWGSLFLTLTSLSVRHHRPSSHSKQKDKQTHPPDSAHPLRVLLSHAMSSKHSRNKILSSLAALCCSICLRLFMSIKVSQAIGKLGSLLSHRKWRQLSQSQMQYALWTIPAAIATSLVSFCGKRLAIETRTALLEVLHVRIGSRRGALVHLKETVVDADQRVSMESEKVAQDVATVVESTVKPVLETCVLSVTLARMMGTKQLLMCYAYFGIAASWTRKLTPSVTSLSGTVQHQEGKLRAAHSRLKEYAEEIEFMDGVTTETKMLDQMMTDLASSSTKFAFQQFLASALDNYVVRYMGILVALGMMSPALSKRSKTERVKDPTSFFLTCFHLLVSLMGAFKDVALAFRTLSTLRGSSQRILDLVDVLDSSRSNQAFMDSFNSEHRPTSPSSVGSWQALDTSAAEPLGICIHNITLQTPERANSSPSRPLFSNLSLQLRLGESVFLQGENMIGKTSLMRAIANLWPLQAGEIQIPPQCKLMFLTQRPYVVPGLSLKEQVCYPRVPSNVDDDLVIEALRKVGLWRQRDKDESNLEYDLNAPCEGMSAGEMQRLVCARALVQPPDFLFLDEAMCSCTELFEREFVQMCMDRGITVVLISHRHAAKDLFPRILDISANGAINDI